MNVLTINGVDVDLPEQLRPQQREFMEFCLQCFIDKKNGMLEFSDALGRTDALLGASLSWLQHCLKRGDIKHVLYLSGTEQELLEAIKKFEKSNFASHIKMIRLNCPDNFKAPLPQLNHLNSDSMKMIPSSIIFCTQKMFFQELTLTPNYDFQNTLVLIDDAFEVQEACQISSALSLCKVDHLIKQMQSSQDSPQIISKLDGLKKVFRCLSPHTGNPFDPAFKGAQEIYNVFQRCCATLSDSDVLSLSEHQNLEVQELLHLMYHVKLCTGSKMENSCTTSDSDEKAFNMYVTEISTTSKNQKNHLEICRNVCRTLHFICLDSSVLFKRLTERNPHSVILSSSTISPFGPLKSELGFHDAREFIGRCIVEDYQVFARTVSCGVGGQFLHTRNSLDPDYQTSLGKTILDVAKATPASQGMTIYFSSNEMLEQSRDHWHKIEIKGKTLWQLIGQEKEIVSSAKSLDDDVGLKQKGKCIFAVFQREDLMELKKISKNLDCHRVVLIVGVPYPSEDNPKVALKIKYNDEQVSGKLKYNDEQVSGKLNVLTGRQYTRRVAYLSVRGVIDDIINSDSDFGVILLCGRDYDVTELSPWLKGKILPENRFSNMLCEMNDFFNNIQQRTEWALANTKNPSQSSIQFGSVKTWEVERAKLQLLQLKKKNESLENYVNTLRLKLEQQNTLRQKLEQQLEELRAEIKEMPQDHSMECEASEVGDQSTQAGSNFNPSPMKLALTPRKRMQSEAEEVGDRSRLSPFMAAVSPRKRPYHT